MRRGEIYSRRGCPPPGGASVIKGENGGGRRERVERRRDVGRGKARAGVTRGDNADVSSGNSVKQVYTTRRCYEREDD